MHASAALFDHLISTTGTDFPSEVSRSRGPLFKRTRTIQELHEIHEVTQKASALYSFADLSF